jgi:chemotaxis-related protein WspD
MQQTTLNDCWNKIGVWSNANPRCAELEKLVHCRNCPVYSSAGRKLLDRAQDAEYIDQWTLNLAMPRVEKQTNLQDALAFRLGEEWFALPNHVIREITYCTHHHSLPHRKSPVLRGIVNVRGELLLCVSLGYLFKLQKGEKPLNQNKIIHERYIVITDHNEHYAFPVSEVRNMVYFNDNDLQKVPSTTQSSDKSSSGSYIRGIIQHDDINIGLIDTDVLFSALQRNI